MNGTDEDLDLFESEEEGIQQPLQGGEPELTFEQKRIKELEEENASLKSSGKPDDSMKELLSLGRQFLERSKPEEKKPDTTGDVKTFGEMLQKAIISGDGTEVGQLFLNASDRIATARLEQGLNTTGTPIAEKAGRVAVRDFLDSMGDELGPNAERTHKLVAKEFKLTPQESAWVATADAAKAEEFLRGRYRQVAGDILMRSSTKARPKDLSGGTGGGAGGLGALFPGVSRKRAQELEDLAKEWWPDDKVREAKLKEVAAGMTAEE